MDTKSHYVQTGTGLTVSGNSVFGNAIGGNYSGITFSGSLYQPPMTDKTRYAVVSESANPTFYETEAEALERAEAYAHFSKDSVTIFKAIKKVSPKREVTVTDIP